MALSKIFQNNRYNNDFHLYVADTVEDVKKMKVSPAEMGSEVYIISEKKTYILDSKRVWHVKTVNVSGNGGSGSGDDNYNDGIFDGGTIDCNHDYDENII